MKGAVTASTQEAAEAGLAALHAGGNAVDAIVAAALASCVADPCNTGLGGYGGYLVVHRPGAPASCVAFPASPPPSLAPEAFDDPVPDTGPGCSTVPNVVAGLGRAHREFATLGWSRLCESAVALAEGGVLANGTTQRAFAQHWNADFIAACFELRESVDVPTRRLRFRQPQLAATLRALAAEGAAWFYEGPLKDIAENAWRGGHRHLSAGEWRRQLDGAFVCEAARWWCDSLTVHSAPLGLSGSAMLFAYLEAGCRMARDGRIHETDALAEVASAMARTWLHRASDSGGYDFDRVPLSSWIDAALAGRPSGAPSSSVPEHTAHLNAVDGDGMAAALTFTHGPRWFGGHWCLEGTGVLMNAGMRNCTRSSLVRRGGRFVGVSNMCPSIAEHAGRRVAVGCPGARRIPSNIALALIRYALRNEGLQASVSGGRVHAERLDVAFAEVDRLPVDVVDALRARFGSVEPECDDNYYGPLTAVSLDGPGRVEVGVDDRGFRGYAACMP